MTEEAQEARIFEGAERVGEAVRDLIFERAIGRLRGAAAPNERGFVRGQFIITPERVIRIITAPGLPLAGHDATPTIDNTFRPDGERWELCWDGTIIREIDGEPVSLQPFSGRAAGHPISGEDVWRVMANLLASYSAVKDSLRQPKGPKVQRDAIRKLAPALRIVAREIDNAFPMQVEVLSALAHLAKELSPDVDVLARSLDRQAKRQPEALKAIVKALDRAFEQLYGKRAGGHAEPEKSPANRFAVAFLRCKGHFYEYASISDARRGPRSHKKAPSSPRKGGA